MLPKHIYWRRKRFWEKGALNKGKISTEKRIYLSNALHLTVKNYANIRTQKVHKLCFTSSTISSFCIANNVMKLQISNFFEKDEPGLIKVSVHFQYNKNNPLLLKRETRSNEA